MGCLFLFEALVAENGTELSAYLICFFSELILLLALPRSTLLFNLLYFPLVVFLLGKPKEVLIELCELFENRSFPRVLAVVLRYFDDGVDHLHYELSVVLIL
jgi:hypothetical protein